MKEKIGIILLSALIIGGLIMIIVGIVNGWIRHIIFGAIVYVCATVAFYYLLYSTAEDYNPKTGKFIRNNHEDRRV